MLWILQDSSVIKTNQLIVGNPVVFVPRNETILVGVKLWESFLGIIQSVRPVDMLDPQRELLCGHKTAEAECDSHSPLLRF